MSQLELFKAAPDRHMVRPHHFYMALRPDDGTATDISDMTWRLRSIDSVRGRWIGKAGYHVSLMSLGHSPELVPSFALRAAAAAQRVVAAAFDLRVTRSGTFGQKSGSCIGYLGFDEVPAALSDLRQRLRTEVLRSGLHVDGRTSFKPHVTVVRDADRPLPERKFPPILWRVDRIVLVRTMFEPVFRQDDLISVPLWP